MKLRLVFFVVCAFGFSLNSIAQSRAYELNSLFSLVAWTDSITERSNKVFYLEKFLDDDHNYRETWRYGLDNSRIIYFQIDFKLDSTEFTEVYYLRRGNLFCSEEYETVKYSLSDDEIKNASICYFIDGSAKHKVIAGKKNSSMPPEYQESLTLQRFNKRLSELKMHLPMLPREQ